MSYRYEYRQNRSKVRNISKPFGADDITFESVAIPSSSGVLACPKGPPGRIPSVPVNAFWHFARMSSFPAVMGSVIRPSWLSVFDCKSVCKFLLNIGLFLVFFFHFFNSKSTEFLASYKRIMLTDHELVCQLESSLVLLIKIAWFSIALNFWVSCCSFCRRCPKFPGGAAKLQWKI